MFGEIVNGLRDFRNTKGLQKKIEYAQWAKQNVTKMIRDRLKALPKVLGIPLKGDLTRLEEKTQKLERQIDSLSRKKIVRKK